MMTYVWTEELSVGVKELDDQHRHLFNLINALIAKSEAGEEGPEQEVLRLLDELMNYNVYHLGIEEEHMQAYDCVSKEHFESHQTYRDASHAMAAEAHRAVASGNGSARFTALRELAQFAGDWHLRHIAHADKTYTKCFNDHGLH
ncbi:MAG: hypothetical protein RLZZ324_849 [Candidatus Parcubacteria bacterium]